MLQFSRYWEQKEFFNCLLGNKKIEPIFAKDFPRNLHEKCLFVKRHPKRWRFSFYKFYKKKYLVCTKKNVHLHKQTILIVENTTTNQDFLKTENQLNLRQLAVVYTDEAVFLNYFFKEQNNVHHFKIVLN